MLELYVEIVNIGFKYGRFFNLKQAFLPISSTRYMSGTKRL